MASELPVELFRAMWQSSVFIGLSNIHICIYGVKRANYQRSYFEPCGKSAFFVSITGDSWKRESERERGVRQSGVFLVSPVTGAKSTTAQ